MDQRPLIARVGGIPAGADLQSSFQQEVAQLLQRNRPSFPGAQPVSFAARHIDELKRRDYYVCEKTDGIRYLMYLTQDGNQDIHYLIDRKNDYYYIPHLHFPHHEDKSFERFHTGTILDGELVEDKFPDHESEIKFLVFDCLVLDNDSLMHRPLDKRLAYFKARVLEPYRKMFKERPQMQKPPFTIEDKSTEFSYALPKMFHEIIPKVKRLHGNDGLIFTCKDTPYHHGTDEHILKWKPPEENTVDFLLHITWPKLEPHPSDSDQSLQEDYLAFPEDFGLWIFTGNTDYSRVGTLHVEPAEWESLKSLDRPLQHAIVECFQEDLSSSPHQQHHSNGNGGPLNENGDAMHVDHQPAATTRWRFHRLRDDKTDANHISTYESVIDSIEDHVTADDLLSQAEEIRTAWKARAAREAASSGKQQQQLPHDAATAAAMRRGTGGPAGAAAHGMKM